MHLATMPRFQIRIGLTYVDATTASLTQNYRELPADPHIELSIPGGPQPVRSLRIEIADVLASATDEVHIHVRDIFFFSSRRRHTRLTCDWSSDVCSSD